MVNREGFYDDGVVRECTKCRQMFTKTSKTVTYCGRCNSERVKSSAGVEQKLYNRAKNRCRKSGLEFSIDIEDIVIPDVCPYLGLPLKVHVGSPGGRPSSPSLDRIDNEKGYTKNNIEVVSLLANMMKSSANKEQLIKFARRVLETFGED